MSAEPMRLTTEHEVCLWSETLVAVAQAGDGVSDGDGGEGYAIAEADAAVRAYRARREAPP